MSIGSFDKTYEKEISDCLVLDQNADRHRYYYIDDIYIGIVPENLAYVFTGIVFENDKAEIQSEFLPQLVLIKDYLQLNRKVNIIITGHTDNTGTETYNEELSLERAKSLSDYLINNGIQNNRVLIQGAGSKKPISTNDSEIGKRLNRRVEIEFIRNEK